MGKYEKYDRLVMPRLGLNDIDVRDLRELMQREGRSLPSAPETIPGVEPASSLQ